MTVAPGLAGCDDRRPPRAALVRQGGSAPAPDRFLAQARGQGAGTRGLAAGPHRAQSAVAVVPAVGYFAAECLVQLARDPVRELLRGGVDLEPLLARANRLHAPLRLGESRALGHVQDARPQDGFLLDPEPADSLDQAIEDAGLHLLACRAHAQGGTAGESVRGRLGPAPDL